MIVKLEIEKENWHEQVFIQSRFIQVIGLKKLFQSLHKAKIKNILLDCLPIIWFVPFQIFYLISFEGFVGDYCLEGLYNEELGLFAVNLFQSTHEISVKVHVKDLLVSRHHFLSFPGNILANTFIKKTFLFNFYDIPLNNFETFRHDVCRIAIINIIWRVIEFAS